MNTSFSVSILGNTIECFALDSKYAGFTHTGITVTFADVEDFKRDLVDLFVHARSFIPGKLGIAAAFNGNPDFSYDFDDDEMSVVIENFTEHINGIHEAGYPAIVKMLFFYNVE